jgi:hypothetical protein
MPPYISDAERERARWMTLTELTADVTKRHRGRPADQQIRNALDDRKLIIKWEDATADQLRRRRPTDPPAMSHPDGLEGSTLVPDRPPDKAGFWQQACIDGDKVFDPETERWRTLLLRRLSVQQIWPSRKGGAPIKYRGIEEKMSGAKDIPDAIRLVRARWSPKDGTVPPNVTIRRRAKKLLGDNTGQN